MQVVGAQITVTPATQEVFGDAASFDIEAKFTIQSTSNETQNIFWALEFPDGFPSQWLVWVCDIVTCYNAGTNVAPANRPNVLDGNRAMEWSLHAMSTGLIGTATPLLHITNADGDTLSTVQVTFNTNPVSTKETISTANISIYPNPATDYFKVQDDQQVKQIGIFTITGKNVRTIFHRPGMQHDVSDLRNALYLVRLMNAEGKVIKSLKLSKK